MRMTGLAVIAALSLGSHDSNAQETNPKAQPSVTLPAPLDRVLRDYERAWSAGNAAQLARLFAEDGFVLRGGHPPVRGRAAIENIYRDSGTPLSLRAFAYAAGDSVGYILGGYAGAAGAEDAGKYVLTLRKVGGRWLITADMDNVNRR